MIHVAAAATYTLLVLAACAVARGRARGAEGVVRGLLAAVIMLAPQLGYGAFVLLLSPDHVGTQVPLLLGWLLLDRAQSTPAGTQFRLSPGNVAAPIPQRPHPGETTAPVAQRPALGKGPRVLSRGTARSGSAAGG